MSQTCPLTTEAAAGDQAIKWTGRGTCPLAGEAARRAELGLPDTNLGCGTCIHRLTHKQQEVLALIAEGLTTAGIAGRLGVSIKTIEAHRRNLFRILRENRVARLTKYAIKQGLTSL